MGGMGKTVRVVAAVDRDVADRAAIEQGAVTAVPSAPVPPVTTT
jgi:hypothetical protein